jgi:hypothetical protein
MTVRNRHWHAVEAALQTARCTHMYTARVKRKRDLEEGRAADKRMMSGDVVVKWPASIAHTYTSQYLYFCTSKQCTRKQFLLY